MNLRTLLWHHLRFGLWRGFLASILGSAVFGLILLLIFFANEALTRGVWPGVGDLALVVIQRFPMWKFKGIWVIVRPNSTGKDLTDGSRKFIICRQFA